MIPKPEAIIFDLDDTLIMSDGTMEKTWMEICRDYAETDPGVQAQALFSTIRQVAEWYWSDETRHREGRTGLQNARRVIVRGAFEKLGLPNMTVAEQIADNYSEKRLDSLELFPGVHEVLSEIRDQGLPMALLTNGEQHVQQAKIDKFDLQPYFKFTRIEGEVGFGKPEHQAYLETLDLLGVSPSDSWIVGDNLQWEVEIPKSLGIFTIWMNFYHGENPHHHIVPDRIIHRIEEIRPLLQESNETSDT